MYSEYASGIAFLIKNKLFNQMMKGLPLDRVCAVGILTDCAFGVLLKRHVEDVVSHHMIKLIKIKARQMSREG